MRRTGLGLFWLLPGFLAPLAATVTSVGTIAAVSSAAAEFLAKAAGPDTDFGKAMLAFRDVANYVKLPSIFAAGYTGLIAGGIPQAFQQGAARWYELLRSPIEAAGGPAAAAKVPEVARTLAWAEKSLATSLPASIATQGAGQLTQAFAAASQIPAVGAYATQLRTTILRNALDTVKGLQEKFLVDWWKRDKSAFPPSFDENKVKQLAEAQVVSAIGQMLAAPPPPPVDLGPGVHAPRFPAPSSTEAKGTSTASRSAGNVAVTLGLIGLAGTAAVKFTPQQLQRKLRIPRVSNKQLLIAGGVSGALTILGLVLRSRQEETAVAQIATSDTAAATVSQILGR